MRTTFAAVAAGLAVLAAVASAITGETDVVVFFVVLAAGATIVAALAAGPWTRPARLTARALATAWVVAAIWIGGLLIWYQSVCGCSQAAPVAEEPALAGIPLTFFHLAATYLGGALVLAAAFSDRHGVRGAARR